MTTDKPVYLLHHTIPPRFQGEVHKCLDTWLWQCIIRPSQSSYATQVVTVYKKTGEIHLYMDYQKLNSVMVRDIFPLCSIDEALQAIHSGIGFHLFDMVQGYPQLAMEEINIKKSQFNGLYEFTHMAFWFQNADSHLCHLMEQCLGDQEFVTLSCISMKYAHMPLQLMICWTV